MGIVTVILTVMGIPMITPMTITSTSILMKNQKTKKEILMTKIFRTMLTSYKTNRC